MAIKVFVSAGTPGNAAQESFRDAVINSIETAGLIPRVMTDRDWDRINPLRGIRRAMEECTGAVIIAYARYIFPDGLELRIDGDRNLKQVAFPTAWNAIEAAMAYERGFPILVVAQKGLREDAFLESTGDVRPFWTDMDSDVRQTRGFLGYLQGWRSDVEKFAADVKAKDETAVADAMGPEKTMPEFTIKHLVHQMPWYEAIGLLMSIFGTLLGAATVGYRIGAGQWPFG